VGGVGSAVACGAREPLMVVGLRRKRHRRHSARRRGSGIQFQGNWEALWRRCAPVSGRRRQCLL